MRCVFEFKSRIFEDVFTDCQETFKHEVFSKL